MNQLEIGQEIDGWIYVDSGRWSGGERYLVFKHVCGAQVKHRSLRLVNKKKCKKCEARIEYRSEKEQIVLNDVYRKYKSGAKKRNYSFELSKQDFVNLVMAKCFYCTREPWSVKKIQPARRKEWHGDAEMKLNGVDRMDNTKGYTVENSISCCYTCNMAKKCMSLDEWREMVSLWARAAGL